MTGDVMHPLNAYPLHTVVIGKENKQKKTEQLQISHTVITIPFAAIATVSTGRGCQLERKWCALTSVIQNLPSSLCFSSPPLSLCLSLYLLNGRQHIGHAVPMRLQQNTTCLTWDNTSQSHWVRWQRPVDRPQPCWQTTFHGFINISTNDVESIWDREAKQIYKGSSCFDHCGALALFCWNSVSKELASHMLQLYSHPHMLVTHKCVRYKVWLRLNEVFAMSQSSAGLHKLNLRINLNPKILNCFVSVWELCCVALESL